MNLTSQEGKLVAQLRKCEAGMFRFRYWFLFLGILSWISAAAGFYFLHDWSKKSPETAAILISCFFPLSLLLSIQGAYFMSTAIRDWHGNATRVLLLKLMDAHTGNDDAEQKN